MSSRKIVARLMRILAVLVVTAVGAAAYAQTGDPVIDAMIWAYPQKGGNNYPPVSLQIGNYTNGWDKCRSPQATSWETKCPSDLTYTPGSNGGYQAFGVGHMSVPGQDYWASICYWTWWLDPLGENPVWGYICDYYYLGWVPAHSFGKVGGQIAWSTTYVNTPPGTFRLSTLALKRAPYFNGYPQYDCNPGFWTDIVSAVCNPSDADRFIIPYGGYTGGGVTYEDKVQLQNSGCTAIPIYGRTDDSGDRDRGCYSSYDSDWSSDLPGAYKDTTKFDSAALFVPGVGAAQPQNIQEGYIYGWWMDYWAWGLGNVLGQTKHVGAVTWYENHFTCVAGSFTLCQFVTDQTFIGSSYVF